jgi:1-phosphatidylinositol phosphodiesterase
MKRIFVALVFVTGSIALLHPVPARAHETRAYSHDAARKTWNPDWMSRLWDSLRLSQLSIPGTHDTMALYGGGPAQTQSLSLNDQLDSGIRVLDIRLRHINDGFAIHHGPIYQHANFTDVLSVVTSFLIRNPGETVLMRVKEEYDPSGNKRSFEQTFATFYDNPGYNFWRPTSANLAVFEDPPLGEMRGKMVVLQDFSAYRKYGLPYGKAFIATQDDYHVTWGGMGDKWNAVKNHLIAMYRLATPVPSINYLSGTAVSERNLIASPWPYAVASGHSSPGTGAPRLVRGATPKHRDFPRGLFEGMNVLTYDLLYTYNRGHMGMIMADFPGPGLIERIIELNNSLIQTVPNLRWFNTPGRASAGAIGGGGQSWALAKTAGPDGNYRVHRWSADLKNWVPWIPLFSGVRIAADALDQPWVVTKNNELWYYDSSKKTFLKYDNNTTDIAIGSGEYWKISAEPNGAGGNVIYRRQSQSPWRKVDGAAITVAIERAGVPWVINKNGDIFRLTNNGIWRVVPGKAEAIGAANGHVFVISGENIFKWNGVTWVQTSGQAKQIAVRTDGVVLVVTGSGDIFTGTPTP